MDMAAQCCVVGGDNDTGGGAGSFASWSYLGEAVWNRGFRVVLIP